MEPEDLHEWLESLWGEYEESLRRSGESEAAAQANVARNRRELFDGDEPKPGHYFFVLRSGVEVVGRVWIACSSESPTEAYIFDVIVPENHRGEGWGREVMLRAEDWARGEGISRIGLNVFGYNTVARRLYESLGYRETAIRMLKDLNPPIEEETVH
jgi:ribosomal protein S18 acetylase RimI-like enzyme